MAMLCVIYMLFVLLGLPAATSGYMPSVPLPTFGSVEVDTTISRDSAVITVLYRSPEKPHTTWFVDGFPIPDGRVDFVFYNNWGSGNGAAILSVSRDKGKPFTLCLNNRVGRACLDLNAVEDDTFVAQQLDFPWPLLVPAPLARYVAGQKVRVHAPSLQTDHDYAYSARLLAHNPAEPNGKLIEVTAQGTEGGLETDLPVKIEPVTSAYGGWMVVVETDRAMLEGELIVSVRYSPESELVRSCTLSRPIAVHPKDHTPFYPGFIAMAISSLPWGCRPGFDCLVTCPFVTSASDVNVTLSRMRGGGFLAEHATKPVPDSSKEILWLGEVFGTARFLIENFRPLIDSGRFVCQASTRTKTATSTVFVESV